ncbi:chorismate mutase [Pedobacter sp. N23S346]|uniref:chorismate mutase n=1 Tax=Pedobacter sp. N23S346 TaxID=3402750 RepID=UPI003ACD0716
MKLNKYLLVAIALVLSSSIRMFAQSAPSTNELESNRKKIDSLDKQLIELMAKREVIVKEIGIYKAKNHIPPLQAARFQQVLQKNIEAGKKQGLSQDFVTEVFNAIHKESLRIEEDVKALNPQ